MKNEPTRKEALDQLTIVRQQRKQAEIVWTRRDDNFQEEENRLQAIIDKYDGYAIGHA